MFRAAILAICLAGPASAAPCGGEFEDFAAAMQAEAIAAGTPPDAAAAFFSGVRQDPKVLKADRSQGVFRKTFLEFSRMLISKQRLATARATSGSVISAVSRPTIIATAARPSESERRSAVATARTWSTRLFCARSMATVTASMTPWSGSA